MTYLERAEEQELFRKKQSNNANLIFATKGSAGRNPVKLAQILSVFDFNIGILGWQEKPLADLSSFFTQYQASVDAKYHIDFKEVLIAEEIERKRSDRKGISVTSQ